MIDQNNADELLNLLTKGIGAELGKDIRFQYYNRKKAFYSKLHEKHDLVIDEIEILANDLLALGVYYEKVIAPFYCTQDFKNLGNINNFKSISIGNYEIDQNQIGYHETLIKQFYAIIKSFGLEIKYLNYIDSESFMDMLFKLYNGELSND